MNTNRGYTRTAVIASVQRATGVVFGALLATLLTAGPALAQPPDPPAPQLSISVDNGRTTAAEGDTLDYTVTVRNLVATEVRGLTVRQTMPVGLELTSAEPGHTVESGAVSWGLDLQAGGEATFRSTLTVKDTPPDLLRLATVACASISTDGPPIVCATHSDQLPAGAAAEADRAVQNPDASTGSDGWWYAAGGGVLVIVALATLILRRRWA